MAHIKVTVSVEIDAGDNSQYCSSTIRDDEGNPVFYALAVEKAAAAARDGCVEMVVAAHGGRERVNL